MRLPLLAALLIAAPLAALAQMPTGQLPAGHPPIGGQSVPGGPMHSGSVLETLAADRYVYIHVKEEAGDQWLATTAMELKTGAQIRWPEGMLMTNFFSKTLNRTFDKVYFVNSVEVMK